MVQVFKLAWRNIWRKKKRSVIAIGSVAFALIITISIRSLQMGAYDRMMDAAVKNIGYFQIHQEGYWQTKSINDLMEESPELEAQLASVAGVKSAVPRLENFVLAAGPKNSKDALLIGIHPERESKLNKLQQRVIEGRYIDDASNEVMISEGLARYLNLRINDTLILISQGYQANMAAGKYKIGAIVRLLNPKFNLLNIYMPLQLAQEFNSAPGMLTSYMIDVDDYGRGTQVYQAAKTSLGKYLEVMQWHEISPDILNTLKIDTVLFLMISLALFIIVGFGMMGTVIMMALERIKEFAVLNATGMKKARIQSLILMEAILIGLMGVAAALVIELPLVQFMQDHPIPLTGEAAKPFEAMGAEPFLRMAMKPVLFMNMGGIVLGIMLLSTLYPVWKIKKLAIGNSLK